MKKHHKIKTKADAEAFLAQPYGSRARAVRDRVCVEAMEVAHAGYGRFTPLNAEHTLFLLTNKDEPGKFWLASEKAVVEIKKEAAVQLVYESRGSLNYGYGLRTVEDREQPVKKTVQREDIHSPKNIKPEDYSFQFAYDANPPVFDPPYGLMSDSPAWAMLVEAYKAALDRHQQMLQPIIDSTTSVYSSPNRCDHCGAHLRYGYVFHHSPTDDVIVVGEDCAENTMSVPNRAELEVKRLREAAASGRLRLKEKEEAEKRIKEAEAKFPEPVELIKSWISKRADLTELVAQADLPNFVMNDLPFMDSIAVKFLRKGWLSDKQAAAFVKAHARFQEKQQEQQDEEVKVPCPTGKGIQISGEVVKTDTKEGYYGVQDIMIVKDDRGFVVYGTEPRLLGAEKGDRISFICNIEKVSDRDSSFGFFKRPRKALVDKQ